jgi:hypothetical protein
MREMPLWCPDCESEDYTQVPDGKHGFSYIEVVCNECGRRYLFAINVGAQLARHEEKLRRQSLSAEGDNANPS